MVWVKCEIVINVVAGVQSDNHDMVEYETVINVGC